MLASTFASLAEMMNPGMSTGPLGFILIDTLENTKLLKETKATNVYVLHSKEDRRIPFHHAVLLTQSVEEKSELIEIEGDHADPIYNQYVMSRVSELINVDDVVELARIFSYMKERFLGLSPFFECV